MFSVSKLVRPFGAHHKNLNEDRPILSAMKMKPNDSGFRQYKVYVDILGGFPGERASNDSGVMENVDFQGFRTLSLRPLLFSPLSSLH